MTGKSPTPIGQLGLTVIENIKSLRVQQRLNYTELAAKVTEAGRPLNAVGIRRIEEGERRLDIDEIAAMATALGVTVQALLDPDAMEFYRSQCLRWLMAEDDHHKGRNTKPFHASVFTINNALPDGVLVPPKTRSYA